MVYIRVILPGIATDHLRQPKSLKYSYDTFCEFYCYFILDLLYVKNSW